MKACRIAYIFIACLFMFPFSAHAQYYGFFDNPALKKEMDHSILYPTGIIKVEMMAGEKKRQYYGSASIILSSELRPEQVCAIEKELLKDDPLCKGGVRFNQVRTYMLTANHLFEVPKAGSSGDESEEAYRSRIESITWSELASKKGPTDLVPDEQGGGNAADKKKDETPPIPFTISSITVLAYANNSDPKLHMEAVTKRFSATLIAYDKEHDLALIRIDHDVVFPYVARVAPKGTELEAFRTVWAAGAPMSYGPMVTMGAFFPDMVDGGVVDEYFLTSAPIGPGNSGGGLYWYSNEHRFELIGVSRSIAVSGVGAIPHVTLSVPLPQIHDFLEKNGLGFMFEN